MAQILGVVVMVLRGILAGLFAMTPRMFFWASVLGVLLMVWWLLPQPQQGQHATA